MRMFVVVVAVLAAIAPDTRSVVADRVMTLTRASAWTRVAAVPIAFRTFHPQGMVKIGETLFVSSVEVIDRDTGKGVGHLFTIDMAGRLVADLRLGEGAMYHPGGIDYDGTNLWVPVAEYRPDSRSIIYRVDSQTMKAVEAFRAGDHIGAIVYNQNRRTLHGVSWGSRRFYRWSLAGVEQAKMLNPSHYVDYQDCKYAGHDRMLCSGVAEIRHPRDAPPFRLGGLDLISLADGRPLHQVPVLLWAESGLDMTHNPVWLEPSGGGLRAYFMPDDDRSTLYIYDVT
jgi:Family of unknown function (DUF6454)